jgi:hypothetical protein
MHTRMPTRTRRTAHRRPHRDGTRITMHRCVCMCVCMRLIHVYVKGSPHTIYGGAYVSIHIHTFSCAYVCMHVCVLTVVRPEKDRHVKVFARLCMYVCVCATRITMLGFVLIIAIIIYVHTNMHACIVDTQMAHRSLTQHTNIYTYIHTYRIDTATGDSHPKQRTYPPTQTSRENPAAALHQARGAKVESLSQCLRKHRRALPRRWCVSCAVCRAVTAFG